MRRAIPDNSPSGRTLPEHRERAELLRRRPVARPGKSFRSYPKCWEKIAWFGWLGSRLTNALEGFHAF
jgi:hypothetical protein